VGAVGAGARWVNLAAATLTTASFAAAATPSFAAAATAAPFCTLTALAAASTSSG